MAWGTDGESLPRVWGEYLTSSGWRTGNLPIFFLASGVSFIPSFTEAYTNLMITPHKGTRERHNLGVIKPAWNHPNPSQAKPSRLGLACITKKGFLAWLGLACKFKKRALAWFWLGISSGNSSWLYLMTFQPWHQNQTFSESLKLIVLWNLITIYRFFLSFEYWLGPTCNIILTFRLGLAWLVLFLEIKRLGLAWFGFFWCSFGLAWLGLEYFYHMKAWLGLACSEKTRLDDP